jgi:hypothetical protein
MTTNTNQPTNQPTRGKNMSENDIIRKALEAFPNATISEDADGQIIINTGLHLSERGEAKPFETGAQS